MCMGTVVLHAGLCGCANPRMAAKSLCAIVADDCSNLGDRFRAFVICRFRVPACLHDDLALRDVALSVCVVSCS